MVESLSALVFEILGYAGIIGNSDIDLLYLPCNAVLVTPLRRKVNM